MRLRLRGVPGVKYGAYLEEIDRQSFVESFDSLFSEYSPYHLQKVELFDFALSEVSLHHSPLFDDIQGI